MGEKNGCQTKLNLAVDNSPRIQAVAGVSQSQSECYAINKSQLTKHPKASKSGFDSSHVLYPIPFSRRFIAPSTSDHSQLNDRPP